MLRWVAVTLIVGLTAASATAQMRGMGGMAGCCSGSPVELKGKVTRVQITPGEGMPFVMMRTGDRTAKVYLGSMRYLVAQGLNPKVDDEIVVKAYPVNGDYVAASVTLVGSGKTVRLRDENGRPLWRGGPPR